MGQLAPKMPPRPPPEVVSALLNGGTYVKRAPCEGCGAPWEPRACSYCGSRRFVALADRTPLIDTTTIDGPSAMLSTPRRLSAAEERRMRAYWERRHREADAWWRVVDRSLNPQVYKPPEMQRPTRHTMPDWPDFLLNVALVAALTAGATMLLSWIPRWWSV